jgi:hypothetical protein
MNIKYSNILLLLLMMVFFPASGQSPETPLTGLMDWDKLAWELSLGPGLNRGYVTVANPQLEKKDYLHDFSPGLQAGVYPVYRLSRKFRIRSGFVCSLRSLAYSISGEDEYRERMVFAGLPLYGQYHAGGAGMDFRGFTGFQLNTLVRHRLHYDVQPIPNFRREGTLNLGFDRSRLMAEFHLGVGMRVQVSRLFIGVDLVYFSGITNQNRYAEPRTVRIYDGENRPFVIQGAGFRSHGLMLNLVFHRART